MTYLHPRDLPPLADLQAQMTAVAADVRATAKKAEDAGRDLTEPERAHVKDGTERLKALAGDRDRRKQHDSDEDFHRRVRSITGGTPGGFQPVGAKAADSRWGVKARESVERLPGGVKGLVGAGTIAVPTAFDYTVHRDGETPQLVRQLMPTTALAGTDRFAFMQQSVRELNAAPVARGQLKPTSKVTAERREDRVRVVAHLSEPVDRVDLVDSAALGQFLDFELRFGVLAAGEEQLLIGDGVGENLTGLMNTPGMTVQPYAGDVFTTMRRALTVQQRLANRPTAWVLSPEDWERIELTRENGATGGYLIDSGPVDVARQRLWSLPVVVSPAAPEGIGLLGDFAGSAEVYQREECLVTYTESMWVPGRAGDIFATNQLVFRAEERLGLAVKRPSAFTELDLLPASTGTPAP